MINTEQHHSAKPQNRSPFWLFLWPLAILLRMTNLFGVFVDGKVFLCATDPYFHLRRTLFTINNFPHVPDKDLYLNFPQGVITYWPYGFDIIMAAIISCLTLGHSDKWWAEAISALLPPLIGGLLPLVIYLIMVDISDQFTALFASIIAALLPIAIHFSQIGNFDHHFLAALCQGLFWLAYLRASQKQSTLWGILAGVILLIGFTSTTEFPFVIAFHCIYLFIVWFTVNEKRRNELILINLKIFTTVTVLLLPCVFTRYFEPNGVSPLLASSWFGCFAFMLFLAALALWKKLLPYSFCIVILILTIIVDLNFDFSLIVKLVDQANQSQGNNILGSSIRENRSILFDGIGYLLYWHSGFFLLIPATVLLLIRRRNETNLLILVGLVIIQILSLVHMRLGVLLAVPFALASALVTKEGFILAKHYFSKNHLGEILAGVITFLLLLPSIKGLDFSNPAIVVSHKPFLPLYNSFNWLKQHSPDIDPNQPAYGVLANEWDLGHWLVYFADRPTVSSPLLFGTSVFDVAKIFVESPAKAIKTIESNKLKYIFLTPDDFFYLLELSGQPLPKADQDYDSLYGRLLASYGFPGGIVTHPALNRVRLVYESPEKVEQADTLPTCMIFEVVTGAHLIGQIKPNATITLSTQLKTATNRRILYSANTKADENGNFDFIVPYSTSLDSSTSVLASPYVLKTDGLLTSVKVTTSQIRNGETIKASFEQFIPGK
ncbi:MAG: dolichyl-diphosphooligosaccharide--protein glycosyltransferase [bacterium]|nr:MAG: dolichyl-diphosphooligosaccharide--protein glycosyltransferase [bacterium]